MGTTRRKFAKLLAGAALTGPTIINHANEHILKYNPNNKVDGKVRVGAIGLGIQGLANLRTALKIDGVDLVAACDLYTGRLGRTQELFGDKIITTQDYQALLNRDDIDAVIVSTSDHWHDKVCIAAMNAGKHVYCEKPMVHHIDEGLAVIDAHKKSGVQMQVGSQGVSSIASKKARELYLEGAIGKLVMVEASNNRQSANGAWQYSIPTDASKTTVDWDKFVGDAPSIPYDETHFFRWRNYQAYGTGVPGDLFVHLFSRLHCIIDSNGPSSIFATGGLRYWD